MSLQFYTQFMGMIIVFSFSLSLSRAQPDSQTPIIYWTLLSSTTASMTMRHHTLIVSHSHIRIGITNKKGRIIACHQQGSTDTGVPVPVPSVPMELPVSWPQWSAFLSRSDRVIVTPNPCWVWKNIRHGKGELSNQCPASLFKCLIMAHA